MNAVMNMLALAFIAFYCMFSPAMRPDIPVWPIMTITAAFQAITSLVLERRSLRDDFYLDMDHIKLGVFSAVLLYLLFWAGHFISTKILPFAASQVSAIYDLRAGHHPLVLSLLMLFVIGPAEEVFWRGFVQKRLSKKYGMFIGLTIATCVYALVHIPSGNFMLVAAAALCGAFWGLLYTATRNLWPCIISHALWDVIIFILLPIR